MPKFFVNENQLNTENMQITINQADVNHIANVLRLQVGDTIEIGVNIEPPKTFLACIIGISNEEVICKIEKEIDTLKEAKVEITIFQGIPKSDKMELIIQKCTELGVSKFVPLELARCVAKIEGKDVIKKRDRWQKIAEVAAKQSGRDKIPEVLEKINLKEFCNKINEYDLVLVAYEKEDKKNLRELLSKKINKVAVVIGPEGGFEETEIELLKKTSANIVSLGNRILRTETAPIVLSSIIMYESGEF